MELLNDVIFTLNYLKFIKDELFGKEKWEI